MGPTRVRVVVKPVGRSRPARDVDLLVDSGAVYTVLPPRVWSALGLRAKDKMVLNPLSRDVVPMRLVLARR